MQMRFSLIPAVALLSVTTSSAAILTSEPTGSIRPGQHLAAEPARSAENYSTVEAVSGKTLQLNSHASVTRECNPAPLPKVRLINRPKAGTFTVRLATLTSAQIAGCQNLTLPVHATFYTSRAGYVGEDQVIYEVTTFEGEIEKFDIAINVKPVSDEKPASR